MQIRYSKSQLLIIAVLVWPLMVNGQADRLQGRFYAEKDTYMVGEPVLFNMEIKNTGVEAMFVNAKNPAGCVDTYDLSVGGPHSPVCSAKWNAECTDAVFSLKPGESDHGKWPLNFWYQFEHEGTYDVNIIRHVPVMSPSGLYQDFTFSSKFSVKLTPLDPSRVHDILEDFQKKLDSSDPEVRHSALDVLSSTAPDYFERLALTVSRSKDAFAVLHSIRALERINTAETRAALADLLTTDEPKTEDEILVRIHAIEALGHDGDASYQTLIGRFLEDKNEYIQLNAMAAIAQLGKAQAVPQLQRLFFSPDPVTRRNVASALQFSTTPEAVEVLIDALNDKDMRARETITASLAHLTGHSTSDIKDQASAQQAQNELRAWWRENKANVHFPDHLEFLCHMK